MDRTRFYAVETVNGVQEFDFLHNALSSFKLKYQPGYYRVINTDLGRPELKLRKHDHEFGWFERVAQRHGAHSQERIQAARMMDSSGQAYWPEIFAQTELNSNLGRFGKMEMPTK